MQCRYFLFSYTAIQSLLHNSRSMTSALLITLLRHYRRRGTSCLKAASPVVSFIYCRWGQLGSVVVIAEVAVSSSCDEGGKEVGYGIPKRRPENCTIFCWLYCLALDFIMVRTVRGLKGLLQRLVWFSGYMFKAYFISRINATPGTTAFLMHSGH